MEEDQHAYSLQGKRSIFPCLGEVFPLTEGLLMGDPIFSPMRIMSGLDIIFSSKPGRTAEK
jgi:hypothetical protein